MYDVITYMIRAESAYYCISCSSGEGEQRGFLSLNPIPIPKIPNIESDAPQTVGNTLF